MISPELLLAYSATAFAVIAIPGPTVLLVTGYALSIGLRTALLSILGVCLGDVVAMILTFIGLGAVLAASAELFAVLKWIGAGYLIYLGIELWLAPATPAETDPLQEHRPLKIVARAFAVNVLHPKGLAFYAAFLPQFMRPEYPAIPQMLTLGIVFVSIAFCVLLTYALAASRFRSLIARPRVRRVLNRTSGGCLVGAGLYTAALSRDG